MLGGAFSIARVVLCKFLSLLISLCSINTVFCRTGDRKNCKYWLKNTLKNDTFPIQRHSSFPYVLININLHPVSPTTIALFPTKTPDVTRLEITHQKKEIELLSARDYETCSLSKHFFLTFFNFLTNHKCESLT